MEFMYRAGDDRSRSPPPPPVDASSGSALEIPASEDGHGGDSTLVPCRPDSPMAAAAGGDELRRRAKKEKIRERILREEAEEWELEAEVRRELMGQIFALLGSSRNAATPCASPPAATTTALQAVAKANASASAVTLPAKRKNPATASAATSSKRCKPDLTCAACGITATGEKAMEEHLRGKGHKKKAAALALSAPQEPAGQEEAAEDAAPTSTMQLASDGGYTPTKLSMLTSAGVVYEVLQMDGYLLCEECNVRTADRVTMMCHLEGGKHVSKAMKLKHQTAGKPPAPAFPEKVEVESKPHAMAVKSKAPGSFLVCDACNVKAPSVSVMQSHLAGRKHRSNAAAKAKSEAAISVAGEADKKLEVQETGGMAVEDVASNVDDDVSDAPGGEKATKIARPAPVDVLDPMYCKVRTTSASDMRIHLVGRRHKNKSKLQEGKTAAAAAAMPMAKAKSEAAASIKEQGAAQRASAAATPLPARRRDAADADASMAPTEAKQPAMTRHDGAPSAAGDVEAAAEPNSATTAAAATGQQLKIQGALGQVRRAWA
ncbi:zinc finger protein 346-like isoform X2 [Oryza brachyantha]|uniref:zinc finger protein 346-like isoform X2 n=1 Tax=Oryza brachyantha TaxID=4533 RepID=UPI001ADC9B56|nr:zinc finger protein 346-like isoform X2 [Oryza brachyantha]